MRGGKGRSARPARSQCEAEEVAVRVRRGRSASPKRSQCESENVAVRVRKCRSANPSDSHCGWTPAALLFRSATPRPRTAEEQCGENASQCDLRGLVLLTAWVGARTLPREVLASLARRGLGNLFMKGGDFLLLSTRWVGR